MLNSLKLFLKQNLEKFLLNPFSYIKKIGSYIISVIIIIAILKFFGFFKNTPIKPPITPGDITVITKPSKDSKEILNHIDEKIKLLKDRKNEN